MEYFDVEEYYMEGKRTAVVAKEAIDMLLTVPVTRGAIAQLRAADEFRTERARRVIRRRG